MKKIIIIVCVLLSFSIAQAAQLNNDQIQPNTFTTPAMTSQEVLVHNESASAHSNQFSNYYAKAQTEATVETIIYDKAQAKKWYVSNMATGDKTGEVLIDGMAASCAVGEALYLSSSGWNKAKADADTTLPALGLCVETGTGSREILLRGIVRNTSWSFTKGAKIYLSSATAGAITATKPTTTNHYVQIIGLALDVDRVFFFFDSAYVKN